MSARDTDGERGENEPQKFGFDFDAMNREFAYVLMGSKGVIFRAQPNAKPIDDQQRMLTLEAFNGYFANRFTQVRGSDGKIKTIPWSKAWFHGHGRRTFDGVEFVPDPGTPPITENYLNLWSGFAVSRPSNRIRNAIRRFAIICSTTYARAIRRSSNGFSGFSLKW
jgi:hypothetical protein